MTLKDFVYSLKKAGFKMETEKNGTVSFYHYRYNIMLFMYKKHVYIYTRDNINFTCNEWHELLNCALEKLCSIEKFKDFVSEKLVIKHTIHHDKFEMVSVSFRNKEITDFLLTLGFGDNKTFNFVPNFNITWDYIRGVFEGDGYFRWGSTKEINITSACKEHI